MARRNSKVRGARKRFRALAGLRSSRSQSVALLVSEVVDLGGWEAIEGTNSKEWGGGLGG